MSAHVQIDNRLGPSAPRILLYSSCVAKPLRDYLLSRPQIANKYAVDVLLMHCLEQDGVADLAQSDYVRLIGSADVVAANFYSPKWKDLGLERLRELKKASAPLITWPPPNFAAFWPVVEGYGEEGVERMFRCGAKKEDILDAYDSMKFDPLFSERFPDQLDRLREIETKTDIKIADFCERNHRRVKLWFTSNHPTTNLVAWMGTQIGRALGLELDTEESCLDYAPDVTGDWNTFPETRYEFEHYRFEYPMRYARTQYWGGPEWYRSVIAKICDRLALSA